MEDLPHVQAEEATNAERAIEDDLMVTFDTSKMAGYVLNIPAFLNMLQSDVNKKDKLGLTALHVAAGFNEALVTVLLEKGADVNAMAPHGTPLHIAVQRGNMACVKELLKQKANPTLKNELGNTPLHIAARKNYVDILKCLLDHGADRNCKGEDGRTPLHDASEYGHIECAKVLLDYVPQG